MDTLNAVKINDCILRVTRMQPTTCDFTLDYLKEQRERIVAQKARDNAQRDAELAEVDALLAECDRLKIVSLPVEVVPIEEAVPMLRQAASAEHEMPIGDVVDIAAPNVTTDGAVDLKGKGK